MYAEIVTVAFSTVGGGVAGGLTCKRLSRSPRPTQGAATRVYDCPDDDAWINEAAGEWARQNGRLEAAPLVAAKLRLSESLQRQPKPARRWTWSRRS